MTWRSDKPVNKKLSLNGCWTMVNEAEELHEIKIAEAWIYENEVISNDEYNDLMMALSYKMREAYHRR